MVRINKKAAMELSMSTIVVLVLAMSMLILGLVLIRTIFIGAKYNVETINDKVRDQINQLFVEDEKMVIYLAQQKLDIKQGENWGVAFAVKNLIRGEADAGKFNYEVTVNNPSEVKRNCGGLSEKESLSWIQAGREGFLTLTPGETGYEIIRFSLPEATPLCIIRYTITTKYPTNYEAAGERRIYVARNFDINIEA